jgi:hypothetical protein
VYIFITRLLVLKQIILSVLNTNDAASHAICSSVIKKKPSVCGELNGRIILRWIFRKWDVGVWSGLN